MSEDFFMTLFALVATVVIVGSIVGAVFWSGHRDAERKAFYKFEADRERTHREIAEMVAEDALTTEQAERLLGALARADKPTLPSATAHVAREEAAPRGALAAE